MAFDPLSVGTPRGVYDFDDLTTLFQDTAATSPVTTAGQSIKRVNNKVVAGPYLSEATNAPTWNTFSGVQNCAVFNGTSHKLTSSSTSYWKFLHGANGFTIVSRLVFTDASPGTQVIFDTFNIASGNNGMALWIVSQKMRVDMYSVAAGASVLSAAVTTTSYGTTSRTNTCTWQNGIGGDDLNWRTDGAADGSKESTGAALSTADPAFALRLGARASSTDLFFKGKIRRLAIYEGILTGTDLTNVESWVAADNVTGFLPHWQRRAMVGGLNSIGVM